MKIDRGSIGFRILVPIFVIIAVITLLLLILVQHISDHVQEDYHRFTAAASAHQITTILETAASELITAQLTGNPVVVEAKKRSVGDAVRLSWSRNGQAGIISNVDGAVVLSTLDPEVTHAILARRSLGYFSLADKAGRFHCYMDSFAPWGWTVITVARETSSYLTRKEVGLLVPLITLGSLLMASGLLFILRRNLQRPVAAMVSAVGAEDAVPATGVAELDQIGQAVNDALEKVRDRSAQLATELEERRRAENEVREKEEHIRLLLSSTAEGIYGVDMYGTCTFCNTSGLRLLGYEREGDLLGKNIHRIIHFKRADGSAYPEGECRIYQAYRDKRGVHADDEVFWRKDGTSFPVEYWSYPIAQQGTVAGAVVTFIDISERKRSEAFIRNILETVDEGFLIIDRELTILSANRAYSRQTGMPLEEIVGRKCYEISHQSAAPCSDPEVECSARRAIETNKPCTGVHIHRGSDDVEKKMEIKAYPVRDATGAVSSVIMTTVDITEKSRLEQQLNQAQKMEAIGQLAGGIAHDFNNVLTAIVGYASLLKKQAEEGSQARFFSEQVLASASRAADLTRHILAFSRKQVIQPRPTSINGVVRRMEKFIMRLLGEDIEIRTALTDRDITALVDAGQMEQVLMNLATNARDAMPGGGALIIGTEVVTVDEDTAVRYGLEGSGSYALLSVSDTGSGMDETTRSRIFEPFFTTKAMGRGTGLGLAIVYGIIKQHHGHIMVSSEPNKGSTFTIYLPLTRSVSEAQQAPTDLAVRSGTETILLAEDDPDVRRFIKLALEEHGYTVITAVDGNEAVSKFQERSAAIGLCLFDVIMPKKNGRTAFREIRALRSDAKAIFMSGYSADIIREKDLLEENMVLLNKPVQPQDLLRRVREMLDAGPARARPEAEKNR
jgi:PAS domain S-box-containing protein